RDVRVLFLEGVEVLLEEPGLDIAAIDPAERHIIAWERGDGVGNSNLKTGGPFLGRHIDAAIGECCGRSRTCRDLQCLSSGELLCWARHGCSFPSVVYSGRIVGTVLVICEPFRGRPPFVSQRQSAQSRT